MTTLVNICKELIIRVLTSSIEASAADDAGFFSGKWRTKEVSQHQRKMTSDFLKEKIDSFRDMESDEKSLLALKKLISQFDAEVEEYRKTKKFR